ncbi:hypothetical protein AN218_04500 [Streptomyces nanshensis]|uniref:Uncharacterized protein n=2 Tax=Streptomyces nanshensis TaxID=518642 RepID=A0A1E7LB94_9ACTN|nr:hypothetical protein AN218_04500 [Streptomyces nanshensis]
MYRAPQVAAENTTALYAIEPEPGDWAYALDDPPEIYGPGWYPFHRHVTRPVPHDGAPLRLPRLERTGRTEPRPVRISPNTAYRAWHNEYVTLFGYRDDARVLARTHLYVSPCTVRSAEFGIDLRKKSITVPEACPDNLRQQAEEKARRVLAFLLAARAERRRGLASPHGILHAEMRPRSE